MSDLTSKQKADRLRDLEVWMRAKWGLIWPPARKEGRGWWVVPTARKAERDDPVLKPVWE